MVGPRNKYAILIRVWYSGAPYDNGYWDGSGLYDSKAAYLFTDDDLAHLFPGVKYKKKTEGERILKFVASMKYQVSESRFKWLVEMATKCMAEEELVDEEDEEDIVYWDDNDNFIDPEEYGCIFSEHDESDSIVEKIIVEDDSSEEEDEENKSVENDSNDKKEEDSSDKKEEEKNTIDSCDEKKEDTIGENDSSEDAILARFVESSEDLIVKNDSSEDSAILGKFLYDISEKYEGQVHKQLSEFADYMSSKFSKVTGSQFQWMKMLKESSVKRMEEVPLAMVPYYVYRRTEDWVNWRSAESLDSFVLKILQTMCSNLTMSAENASQHESSETEVPLARTKDWVNWLSVESLESFALKLLQTTRSNLAMSAEKDVQHESSETEVGSLMVLALVLRLKPDVLIGVWPTFQENTKYRVEDKILVLAWVISQAYPRDWTVGVFMWVRYLFPLLSSEPDLSPKSRDIIMQVIDRIGFSQAPDRDPFDRDVKNEIYPSVVKNGERVVPPSALELLAKAAFPADSEQRKATEMLRVRYRFLKNVALCVSPGSEKAKQISEHLVPFAIKTAGEGNSYLTKKARHLFFWCLNNHYGSFKHWDDIYLENLENLDGSVFMLEKLSVKCLKMLSRNLSIVGPMIQTMRSVASKNEEALASEHDASHQATLENAQNYAKSILEKAQKYVNSTLGLGPFDMLLIEEVQTSEDIKTVLGPVITAPLGYPKEVSKHLYNGVLRATCYFACGVAVAYSLDHLRLHLKTGIIFAGPGY